MSRQASRRRKRRSPVEISELVHEYHASGLTRAVFAREHDVAASTLDLWLRRFGSDRQAEPVTAFVAVDVQPGPKLPPHYEVVLPNGLRVVVEGGFDADEVGSLLAVVARC